MVCRSKTSFQWSRNMWTKTSRFVFLVLYCDFTGCTGTYTSHLFFLNSRHKTASSLWWTLWHRALPPASRPAWPPASAQRAPHQPPYQPWMQKLPPFIPGATPWSPSLVRPCRVVLSEWIHLFLSLLLLNVCVVFPFLPGSALDLNFSDINVASLEKELEEQDNSVGLPSEDIDIFCRCSLSIEIKVSLYDDPLLIYY